MLEPFSLSAPSNICYFLGDHMGETSHCRTWVSKKKVQKGQYICNHMTEAPCLVYKCCTCCGCHFDFLYIHFVGYNKNHLCMLKIHMLGIRNESSCPWHISFSHLGRYIVHISCSELVWLVWLISPVNSIQSTYPGKAVPVLFVMSKS